MRTTTLCPVILLLIPALATPTVIHEPTARDFIQYLQSEPSLLVSFSSRTLSSVLSFNDVFTQSPYNTSTIYVTINCDQEVDLCREYDVNTYPTIRLFERDEENDGGELRMTRYRGPRTETALRSFMRKRELPIDTYVSSDDVETFKMVDDVVFIAYLRPDQEDLLKSFSAVARRYHLSYAFGHTTDAATVDAERVSVPSVICYKNTDGDHRVLNGAFTEADLEAFLESAIPSVVKQFKEKDLEVFMQRDRLTLYIFVHTEDLATTIRHELTSLAKKYEKYVTFAIADLKKYRDMATNFGVRDEGESGPMLVVHAPMNDNVFFHQQGKKIRSDLVEGMLTTILQGKAKHRQVFGEESEELQGRVDVDGQHDEL